MRTLRPAILPDNTKLVVYPLVVGLGVAATGVILGNPVVIALPLMILVVFPGLPILFHAVYHFFVQYQIFPDRLVVVDRVSDPSVRSRGRREIRFGDIRYCYYVDTEARLLMSLRKKLEVYHVPRKETDYRKYNLLDKYRVPEAVLDEFERRPHKTLNDTTATGVLLEVETVCERHNVPKKVTKEICQALENDADLNFEMVREKLRPVPVDPVDLVRIRDKFSHLDTPEVSPFLVTQINLKRLEKIESSRYPQAAVRSRVGLVLSNADGTNKVYLMHFRDLGQEDSRELMRVIRDRSKSVQFLMTRKEVHALLQ